MITAMPAVKPTITGSGMNRITAPRRASPIATRITPAISVATSRPPTPNCATTLARITMKAPVGPAIWMREPPNSATAAPAMIEVYRPCSGLTPDAIANAIASGNATMPTTSPAMMFGAQCSRRIRPALAASTIAIKCCSLGSGAKAADNGHDIAMHDIRPPSALTIAGFDSGGGAGIQADLKAFAAHGVHGLSAIAALTAQHTRGVVAVHVPPVAFLRAQIDACFEDFRIGAVKLGMLANAGVIHAVADAFDAHPPPFLVLDPVMVATSGAKLLEDDALEALRTRLIPRADLLTPNIPEAELLTGMRIEHAAAAARALEALREMGCRAVLLKGGHLDEGGEVVDRYRDGAGEAV